MRLMTALLACFLLVPVLAWSGGPAISTASYENALSSAAGDVTWAPASPNTRSLQTWVFYPETEDIVLTFYYAALTYTHTVYARTSYPIYQKADSVKIDRTNATRVLCKAWPQMVPSFALDGGGQVAIDGTVTPNPATFDVLLIQDGTIAKSTHLNTTPYLIEGYTHLTISASWDSMEIAANDGMLIYAFIGATGDNNEAGGNPNGGRFYPWDPDPDVALDPVFDNTGRTTIPASIDSVMFGWTVNLVDIYGGAPVGPYIFFKLVNAETRILDDIQIRLTGVR